MRAPIFVALGLVGASCSLLETQTQTAIDNDARHEASARRLRQAVQDLGDAEEEGGAVVSSIWADSQRALRASLLHEDVRGFRRWRSVSGMFESSGMAVCDPLRFHPPHSMPPLT